MALGSDWDGTKRRRGRGAPVPNGVSKSTKGHLVLHIQAISIHISKHTSCLESIGIQPGNRQRARLTGHSKIKV